MVLISWSFLKKIIMKKLAVILSIIMASAFISPDLVKPGIYGTIEPPDAANKVWAISSQDSVSGVIVGGKFSVDVKPGNWTVVVEALKPYKNAVVSNVLVLENQATDAGVIKLYENK